MENTISVVLKHLGVRVETRITQLGDLLREKLDTVGGVTENDRLVDLELPKEDVSIITTLGSTCESLTLEKRVLRQ